jgi:hypothetical protein
MSVTLDGGARGCDRTTGCFNVSARVRYIAESAPRATAAAWRPILLAAVVACGCGGASLGSSGLVWLFEMRPGWSFVSLGCRAGGSFRRTRRQPARPCPTRATLRSLRHLGPPEPLLTVWTSAGAGGPRVPRGGVVVAGDRWEHMPRPKRPRGLGIRCHTRLGDEVDRPSIKPKSTKGA